MKKIYLLPLLLLSLVSFVEKQANIEFKELIHDFGTMTEGEKPFYDFMFTNTGEAPLVIVDVNKSCGCTEPSFPKEAIMPGDTSYIRVGYNSVGREGRFDKTISVVSNAEDGAIRLRIVGSVLKKD